MEFTVSKDILLSDREKFHYDSAMEQLYVYKQYQNAIKVTLYNSLGEIQFKNKYELVFNQIDKTEFSFVPYTQYQFKSYLVSDITLIVCNNPLFRLEINHSKIFQYQQILDHFWINGKFLCVIYNDCLIIYEIEISELVDITPRIIKKQKYSFKSKYMKARYLENQVTVQLNNALIHVFLDENNMLQDNYVYNFNKDNNFCLWQQPKIMHRFSELEVIEEDFQFNVQSNPDSQQNIFEKTLLVIIKRNQLQIYQLVDNKLLLTHPLPTSSTAYHGSIKFGILSVYSSSLLIQFNLIALDGTLPSIQSTITPISLKIKNESYVQQDRKLNLLSFQPENFIKICPKRISFQTSKFLLQLTLYRSYEFKYFILDFLHKLIQTCQIDFQNLLATLITLTVEKRIFLQYENLDVLDLNDSYIRIKYNGKEKSFQKVVQFTNFDIIQLIRQIQDESVRKCAIVVLLTLLSGNIPQQMFELLEMFSAQEIYSFSHHFDEQLNMKNAILNFKDIQKSNIGRRISIEDNQSVE